MAFPTLEEFKTIKGISDTSHDERISALLPLVQDFIEEYCNSTFPDGFPDGLKLTAIEMVDYHLGVSAAAQAQSIDGNSVQYRDDYPQSIMRVLRKYRRVKFI